MAKRLDPIFPSFSKANAGSLRTSASWIFAVEKRRHRGEDVAKRLMDLRISCADGFLAGRWDDDDRTDRERAKTRARSFLRRNDLIHKEIGAIAKRKNGSRKQYA